MPKAHRARKAARAQAPKRSSKKRSADDPLPPGVHLSINEAAAEFGKDRRTVTKRIVELGLRSSGERSGFPVYRLRDLLLMDRRDADGQIDPEKLPPMERLTYYKAETEKLQLNAERGETIRRADHEAEMSRVLKIVARELETVVDEVERDVGASPDVLAKIETKIDQIRERMYVGIREDDAPVTEPLNGAAALS